MIWFHLFRIDLLLLSPVIWRYNRFELTYDKARQLQALPCIQPHVPCHLRTCKLTDEAISRKTVDFEHVSSTWVWIFMVYLHYSTTIMNCRFFAHWIVIIHQTRSTHSHTENAVTIYKFGRFVFILSLGFRFGDSFEPILRVQIENKCCF